MMLMVSAADMLSLYVGLELQSLSLYVLAAYRRDDARSSEAGLKYFVLGALSFRSHSLRHFSDLWLRRNTQFGGITGKALSAPNPSHGVIFGMVFVCAALAFKISAAPFHMWTPDVYEGAPTPVTAFFAAAPKWSQLSPCSRAC